MDISHDNYLIFVLFEIVVSRVMVKTVKTPELNPSTKVQKYILVKLFRKNMNVQ